MVQKKITIRIFILLCLIIISAVAFMLPGSDGKMPGTFTPESSAGPEASLAGPDESNRNGKHTHSTSTCLPLEEIIRVKSIQIDDNINIYIDLESRSLDFRYGDDTLKSYRISAGTKTDLGDKEKEGDYRTPRGEFYICSKALYSPPKGYLGSRWMLLSYPNIEDAERGLTNNLITQEEYNSIKKAVEQKLTPLQTTVLGSAIGIHGGANSELPRDWTAGCIGMYDQDVEEIYDYVSAGTKVIIR